MIHLPQPSKSWDGKCVAPPPHPGLRLFYFIATVVAWVYILKSTTEQVRGSYKYKSLTFSQDFIISL